MRGRAAARRPQTTSALNPLDKGVCNGKTEAASRHSNLFASLLFRGTTIWPLSRIYAS